MSKEQESFRTKLGFEELFRIHDLSCLILGQKPGRFNRFELWLYYSYSAIINIFVGIGCPLHLTAGLLKTNSLDDIVRTMRGTLRSTLSTTKSFIFWYKHRTLKEVEGVRRQLEERIKEPEDIIYMKHVIYPTVKQIRNVFGCIFIGELVLGVLSSIIICLFYQKMLPFSGYFIFDPYKSKFLFVIAHLYQYLGGFVHSLQSFIVDTYSTMCLVIITGHVHLLSRRVSRIGIDKSKAIQQNNDQLIQQIKDHILILRFHNKFVQLFSTCLFFQVLLTAVNISINGLYIILFAKGPIELSFCMANLLVNPMEIFPCCLYCTNLKNAFENLSSEIYKCNWIDQNKEFKSNLRIFVEQSLRPVTVKAGGILYLDLTLLLAICKTAYTIFMVLIQMK